jgi:hypothetical protein
VVESRLRVLSNGASGEHQFSPLYHVLGGPVTAPSVGVT